MRFVPPALLRPVFERRQHPLPAYPHGAVIELRGRELHIVRVAPPVPFVLMHARAA